MNGPFLCYREIIPPTSVDAARFFSCQGHGDFLVTLTSAAINIYRVISPRSPQTQTGAFFSLVLHSKLFGKPYDVNTYEIMTDSGEFETYMILNFDEGKLSVSRFNPWKFSLEIVCLFNAEEEAIGAGSEVHALTQGRILSPAIGTTPILAIDTEESIACTLLYGQQFIFLSLSSFHDSTSTTVKKNTAYKQFIVDIQQALRLMGPILDYCFLPGYSRPTLAVLQESGPLPSGHSATTRNTCTLSVLAVDTVTKNASLLWKQSRLPHDSICIISLSNPLLTGCVVLVSMNAVLLVSQEAVLGIATCGFASISVSSHIKLQPSKLSEGLELDASRWIEGDDNTVVGSLKDGKLLSVRLITSSESLVQVYITYMYTNSMQMYIHVYKHV